MLKQEKAGAECRFCNEIFPNSDRLFEHLTYMHSIFFCVNCGIKTYGSKTKETLQHKNECPMTIAPNVQCKYCPRKLDGNAGVYQNHLKLCRRIRNMECANSIEKIVDSFDINPQNQLNFESDMMMFNEMIENYDVLKVDDKPNNQNTTSESIDQN